MSYQMSDQQYASLLDAERKLTNAAAMLPKMEECGIDCQQARAKLQLQMQTIQKMKQNFGPAQGRRDGTT